MHKIIALPKITEKGFIAMKVIIKYPLFNFCQAKLIRPYYLMFFSYKMLETRS